MNWGYKIMLTYVLFVLGIGYLVFRSVNQKTDLVTADYYAEELKFQDKIDEHNNASVLSSDLKTEYKNNTLSILFPEEFKQKTVRAVMVIYYPANQDRDITLEFSTSNGSYNTVLPASAKGNYELHISWSVNGVNYYFEKKILL